MSLSRPQKNRIPVFAGLLLAVFFLAPLTASAFLFPFGGMVMGIIYAPPCINGVQESIIGPPLGGNFMNFIGQYTFSYGPPMHPGQYVLGKAGFIMPCLILITCGFVPCVVPRSFAPLILFNGSSI